MIDRNNRTAVATSARMMGTRLPKVVNLASNTGLFIAYNHLLDAEIATGVNSSATSSTTRDDRILTQGVDREFRRGKSVACIIITHVKALLFMVSCM